MGTHLNHGKVVMQMYNKMNAYQDTSLNSDFNPSLIRALNNDQTRPKPLHLHQNPNYGQMYLMVYTNALSP